MSATTATNTAGMPNHCATWPPTTAPSGMAPKPITRAAPWTRLQHPLLHHPRAQRSADHVADHAEHAREDQKERE